MSKLEEKVNEILGIDKPEPTKEIVKQEFKQLNDIYKPVVKDIEVDIDGILKNAGYKKTGKETYVIETQIK